MRPDETTVYDAVFGESRVQKRILMGYTPGGVR